MSEFHVSEYAVIQAKKLLDEKGILAMPSPCAGKPLPNSTEELVKNFYKHHMNEKLIKFT